MTSPDSAEKVLQSVAAEVESDNQNQRYSDVRVERAALEDEEVDLGDDGSGTDDTHESSAAVLEVSNEENDLQRELKMAEVMENSTMAPTSVTAVPMADSTLPVRTTEATSTSASGDSTRATDIGAHPSASLTHQRSAASQQQQQQPPPSSAATAGTRAKAAAQGESEDGSLTVVEPRVGATAAADDQPMTMSEGLTDFKKWSVQQFMQMKQYVKEQVWSTSVTTDPKLSERLKTLMAQREKYRGLLKISLSLCSQVRDLKHSQRELANVFGSFTARKEELGKELEVSCNTQRQIARNGDVLYEALSAFCADLTHLLSKTMEDTFSQLRLYQAARLEYDAYRASEAKARASAEANPDNAKSQAYLQRKEQELKERKHRFEELRKDLTVRVHFLEQNQLKVMTRQLTLFHNATCAYFTGNAEELAKCIRQFHIKMPKNLGADAKAASPVAGATATQESFPLDPLPFPTATELGTPSEALSTLLTQQLTVDRED